MLRINGGEEVAVPMRVAEDGRVGSLPSSAPTDISHALIVNSADEPLSSSSHRDRQRQKKKTGKKEQKQSPEASPPQSQSPNLPSSYTKCVFWSPLSSTPSFISEYFGSDISLVVGVSASPDVKFLGAEQVICYDISTRTGKNYAYILLELEGNDGTEGRVQSDVPGSLVVYRIEMGLVGRRFLGSSFSSQRHEDITLGSDPAAAAAATAAREAEALSQVGVRVRRAALLHQPHRETLCSLVTNEGEWLEFDKTKQLVDIDGKMVVEGGCFVNA